MLDQIKNFFPESATTPIFLTAFDASGQCLGSRGLLDSDRPTHEILTKLRNAFFAGQSVARVRLDIPGPRQPTTLAQLPQLPADRTGLLASAAGNSAVALPASAPTLDETMRILSTKLGAAPENLRTFETRTVIFTP